MTKILVTLTGRTCSGKSTIFKAAQSCTLFNTIVSTTTREKRDGEIEGKDYYFISHDESLNLEKDDKLAELAIYNDQRYGVTKDELFTKLSDKPSILIVEPSGIEHYVKPALDFGAVNLKVWVNIDPEVAYKRFITRSIRDFQVNSKIEVIFDRFKSMMTEENKWFSMCNWDLIVNGEDDPEKNLDIINMKILTMEKEYLK